MSIQYISDILFILFSLLVSSVHFVPSEAVERKIPSKM